MPIAATQGLLIKKKVIKGWLLTLSILKYNYLSLCFFQQKGHPYQPIKNVLIHKYLIQAQSVIPRKGGQATCCTWTCTEDIEEILMLIFNISLMQHPPAMTILWELVSGVVSFLFIIKQLFREDGQMEGRQEGWLNL